MNPKSTTKRAILCFGTALLMVITCASSTRVASAFAGQRIAAPAFLGRVSGAVTSSLYVRQRRDRSSSFLLSAPSGRQPSSFQANNNQNRNFHSTRPRYFSGDDNGNWKVPEYVKIPEDKLDISFVRSSGAGGQNVNKVNTCVQVRFMVQAAGWMPFEVRQRFATQNASRINKEGVYSVEAQEHRTQTANRKAAFKKLETAVLEAWPRPKIRKQRTGISKIGKQRRKEQKQKQKQKKESRRRVDF